MTTEPRISKEDIENKIRGLQAEISGRAADKKQSIIVLGSTIATVVVVIAYLLGRRSGRRRGSRVQIKRY